MRAPLWDRPCAWRWRRRDLGQVVLGRHGLEHVEVDALVLDAEGVVEALQLRHALLERHLAALEAAGDGVAGPLALGAAAGGLAAVDRRCRGRRAAWPWWTRRRLQVVDCASQLSGSRPALASPLSTVTRWGTSGDHARGSRAGRAACWSARCRAGRGPAACPRAFGLVPIGDFTCVHLASSSSLAAIISDLVVHDRAALALGVGAEQALGRELLGRQAAPLAPPHRGAAATGGRRWWPGPR